MNKSIIPTGRAKGTQPQYTRQIISPVQIVNGNVVIIDDSRASYVKNAFLANSTVYSIITQISRKFASIPLIVYEVKPDAKKDYERYKCLKKDFNPNALYQMQKLRTKALEEVEGTDLNKLLENAGPAMLEQMMGFKCSTGAGTLRLIKSETDGRPLELEVLPSHLMRIKSDGTLYGVSRYELNLTANPIPFEPEEIFYWKYWNPDVDQLGTHLYGLSPIKAGLKDITANNSGKTAAANMFQNAGAYGIISRKSGSDEMTYEQAVELRDRLDEKINGNDNKGKVVPINADVTWQQMGLSAVDMNLIESNKRSITDICSLFNFPPRLLSGEHATYNNVLEDKKALVTGVIINECNSFTEGLNNWLVPLFKDKKYHIDFDISALPEMQDDMEKLAATLEKMPYVTWKEKREFTKWDNDGKDDKLFDKCYVPSSLVPLDQLGLPMGEPIEDDEDKGVNDYKR